jgi:hypothetical protein
VYQSGQFSQPQQYAPPSFDLSSLAGGLAGGAQGGTPGGLWGFGGNTYTNQDGANRAFQGAYDWEGSPWNTNPIYHMAQMLGAGPQQL